MNQARSVTRVVASLSGGLDSTTLAYYLHTKYPQASLSFITFDYNQRHLKEIGYARRTADDLEADWRVVDLGDLGLKSSLTNKSIKMPHGRYDTDNQAITVVPGRNTIFLSIAAGIAVSEGASIVTFGAHFSDSAQYPDCRPAFVQSMRKTIKIANPNNDITLIAPFLKKTKSDIVSLGLKLGVHYERTWSCYEGGDRPCLRCGTDVERVQAFFENGVSDPLLTASEWQSAVKYMKRVMG